MSSKKSYEAAERYFPFSCWINRIIKMFDPKTRTALIQTIESITNNATLVVAWLFHTISNENYIFFYADRL